MSIFPVFEDYAPANIQTYLACKNEWFKIYAFTKEPINLLHELEYLNNLLSKHLGSKYEEFYGSLDDMPDPCFVFRSRKKKKK